jgi:hypothetical protein
MKVYDIFSSPMERRETTLLTELGDVPFMFMSVEETAPGFTGLAFFGTEKERPARLTLLEEPDADGSIGKLELLP